MSVSLLSCYWGKHQGAWNGTTILWREPWFPTTSFPPRKSWGCVQLRKKERKKEGRAGWASRLLLLIDGCPRHGQLEDWLWWHCGSRIINVHVVSKESFPITEVEGDVFDHVSASIHKAADVVICHFQGAKDGDKLSLVEDNTSKGSVVDVL